MAFRVLGSVEVVRADGTVAPLGGERVRGLLAALLARRGEVVSSDRLVDLLWQEGLPANPVGALHNAVSRLRRVLTAVDPDRRCAVVTRPPGYLLAAPEDCVDAAQFDRLVTDARSADPTRAVELLAEALRLRRGPAYAGFADTDVARLEAIRLDEAQLAAVEAHAAALLAVGRPAEVAPALTAFLVENPLREGARMSLVRALYALGRHADALGQLAEHKQRLAEELGLEPSAAARRLEVQVLRQEVAELPFARRPPAPLPAAAIMSRAPAEAPGLDGLRTRFLPGPGGRIAVATLGEGPGLVVLPAWVSSLDVTASGRDPRSSLLDRLARRRVQLTLYDRQGTGLSRGEVSDFGLDAAVAELAAVVGSVPAPVGLLAMSGAGPVAVALAARRPELVSRLVLFGTYAGADEVFPRPELRATLLAMVRAHWGMGSRVFADLYRPGTSDEGAAHLARVLRDSADRDIAAGYLEAIYAADVTGLMPQVRAPALVLHYRDDRVIPFTGARQLATGLPDARLVALDGAYHLPDAADLDRIVAAVTEFLDD